MDTALFTWNDWTLKVSPDDQHTSFTTQSPLQPSNHTYQEQLQEAAALTPPSPSASASPDGQQQLFTNTRRSSSALENNKVRSTEPTTAHDHQHPLTAEKQDYQHRKRYSALQFDSSTNPRLDPTTLSALFHDIEPQSAPVSPTYNVSRRPSLSSRIIKKTFDMKSLFVTTFDRYRKDNLEREQTALTIWRSTFEQSLRKELITMATTSCISSSSADPEPTSKSTFTSASSNTLSSTWTPPLAYISSDGLTSFSRHQISKSSQYARFIMMELVSTEENYMRDLYIVKAVRQKKKREWV
jgi:hypothetical protein